MPKTANHAASANRAVRPLNADEKLAVAVLVNLGRPAEELAHELGIAVAKVELWAKEFRDAKAKGRRALFKADKERRRDARPRCRQHSARADDARGKVCVVEGDQRAAPRGEHSAPQVCGFH